MAVPADPRRPDRTPFDADAGPGVVPIVVPLLGDERDAALQRVKVRGTRLRRQRLGVISSIAVVLALLLAVPAALARHAGDTFLIDQTPSDRPDQVQVDEDPADPFGPSTTVADGSASPEGLATCALGEPGCQESAGAPIDEGGRAATTATTSGARPGASSSTAAVPGASGSPDRTNDPGGSPTTTAAVPTTPSTAAPTTTTLVCHNSYDAACGPFSYTSLPATNRFMSITITPTITGRSLQAHLTAVDPDAAIGPDCWTIRVQNAIPGVLDQTFWVVGGAVQSTPGPCPLPHDCRARYGPWDAPAPVRGRQEFDFSYTFPSDGLFYLTVSHASSDGTCNNDIYGETRAATAAWNIA